MLFILLPIAMALYLVAKGTEGSSRENVPPVMTSGHDSLSIGIAFKFKKKLCASNQVQHHCLWQGTGKKEENQWKTLESAILVLLE